MNKLTKVSPMAILLDKKPDGVPLAVWRSVGRLKLWAFLYVAGWLGYGITFFIFAANKATVGVFLLL